jgi:membrane-bound metal-dependent hydrolase YbcI (DUF457 family)
MKGLTHYMTGVCVATFFPTIMLAAYSDNILWTLMIPIGGLFGYLPDFLDFKIARYLEGEDYVSNPGFMELDPWPVANTIAKCIDEAYTSKKPVKLKLQTIKLPKGLWRRYSVMFRLDQREVEVRIGPLVTTGMEVLEGTGPDPPLIAIVKYKPPLFYSYEAYTHVDIWDGPTFQFRRKDDVIYADFIQWHRRWSHSLTLGIIVGLIVSLVFGLISWGLGKPMTDGQIFTIFGVIAGGMWGHVLVDQLGWLGSNLLWPITGHRKIGMGLTRSMDPKANFITTYILVMFIAWNINRFAPTPVLLWTNVQFFVFYLLLPIILLLLASQFLKKKEVRVELSRDREEMDEVSMEVAEF